MARILTETEREITADALNRYADSIHSDLDNANIEGTLAHVAQTRADLAFDLSVAFNTSTRASVTLPNNDDE